jgi:hypothetical protein
MKAFTVHDVFKIVRFTDAPCICVWVAHLTLSWFNYFFKKLSLLGSSLELEYTLNDEILLLSPSGFSFSRNSMWGVFVPMNPAWDRWKKEFLKRSLIWENNYILTEVCIFLFGLSAFSKLWKATISFVISVRPSVRPSVCPSVCLSVRPHGATRITLDGFWWNSIF